MKISYSFLWVIGFFVLFTLFGLLFVWNHGKSRSPTIMEPQRLNTSSTPTVSTVPDYLSPPKKSTSVTEDFNKHKKVSGPSIIKAKSDDTVKCVLGGNCRQPVILTLKETTVKKSEDGKETTVNHDNIKILKICCSKQRAGKKYEYTSYILYAIHKMTQKDDKSVSILPAIIIAVVSFLLALFQELYIDCFRAASTNRARRRSPQNVAARARQRGEVHHRAADVFKRARG